MIITKLTSSYLRLKYRLFTKYPAINICDQLASVDRVLIYMPSRIEHFGVALKSLQKLRAMQPDWKMTVITKFEFMNFIDNKFKVDIIPFSKEDLTFTGSPKSSLKQLIKNTSFDLAIDFKLKFDILGIILFRLSGAPVKVCFDSSDKSAFFNFEIRVNPTESLANKYNTMIKYVTVIADSGKPKVNMSKASV